jgi:phospholipase/lecithinase/hemolysin
MRGADVKSKNRDEPKKEQGSSRFGRRGLMCSRKPQRVLLLWPLLMILLRFPQVGNAYTALVAFGDSYTDTGNAPSSPPSYWNGRFSNGPLWIEDLSLSLGFSYNAVNNFAVSGAESDELGIQISGFGGTSDSSNVLFAIWAGSNDFGNHLNLGTDDSAWTTRINGTVSSLMGASDLLYQKGAREIVLFNQIDLTRVPYILNSYSASFRSYILGKIQIFNSQLASAIPGLLSSHPGLKVYVVDAYSNLNALLNSYSSQGFTKATIGAINDPSLLDTSFSGPGASYVFWDSEHPTAKTHGLIAGWVAAALPPPPPPTVDIAATGATQLIAPATVSISAAVSANGWPIDQVSLFSNGSLVASTNAQPYVFTVSALGVGVYSFTAQATYGTGQTVSSSATQVSVTPPPGSVPPAPWNSLDIGEVGQTGSTYYTSNQVFIVSGSGSDIWDVADAFEFAYQPFSGDGSIIAKVTSIDNTDGYAKAGLMLRETLDPGAANVLAYLTPSSGTGFQNRLSTNDFSAFTFGNSAAAPYWFKLERLGTNFNGYGSMDGTNWTALGSAAIQMGTNIYAGLAVTSHNNLLLNTASFANVRVYHPAPPVPPTPATLSLARLTNGAILLSVAGSTGATYACQISTNLVNWLPFFTNQTTTSNIQVQLARPPVGIHTFYRALLVR